MKNRWNPQEAQRHQGDDLAMRVYSSRLIGSDEDLVLHGGGNTSVKSSVDDLFGDPVEVLYVKGSGWDLATIEAEGFAPVDLQVLRRMSELEQLSDADMVKHQRAAMLDPAAPNPSVEAILHAIIPYKFVDHTHADAVVTLSNTAAGEDRIRELYGERVLVVPYVMPGFVLARKVAEMTAGIDWANLDGMVLMHHGVFSFADDARSSYDRMIAMVDAAERYLASSGATGVHHAESPGTVDPYQLSQLRRAVSDAAGRSMICLVDCTPEARGFSQREDISELASRGPLTPDHVLRTKRTPLVFNGDPGSAVQTYAREYERYYDEYRQVGLTRLDPAPRWVVWPDVGLLAFGSSRKEAAIVADISRHTIRCVQQAEALDRWCALPPGDIFDVEYWELEQAKLGKPGSAPPYRGRVALVTGAASGIGRACVEALLGLGAVVIALDISSEIESMFGSTEVMGVVCDVRDQEAVERSVRAGVRRFGGIDILVSNAGMFPATRTLVEMDEGSWSASLDLNLSSHQRLLTASIPFLRVGMDPAIVIVGSKNVPAPGPGAAAYSAAKAGLNQLARVAALELAGDGIRVNIVHPNAVFDTAIWTDEVLTQRAAQYGLSTEEYRRNNLLGTEVRSRDVADMVCAMAGSLFSRTTGAQVPVDGGNVRVV